MVVSAEKARAKAEARRARILAKSAERLDVVSGLAPGEKSSSDDGAVKVEGNDEPSAVIDGGADGGVDGEGADKANDNENNNVEAAAATTTTAAAENDNTPSNNSNKGARRMA